MSASMIKQILIAVVFAVGVTVAIGFAGDWLMGPSSGDATAEKTEPVQTAAPQPEGEPEEEEASEEGVDLASALRDADLEDGQAVAKKCMACHTFDQGGANRVGPNLWGVVGKAKGASVGYKYSVAMQEIGGTWTYEDLDAFLTKPRDFLPKTRMTYVGLSNPEDRADVIAYLRSLADSPVPLP